MGFPRHATFETEPWEHMLGDVPAERGHPISPRDRASCAPDSRGRSSRALSLEDALQLVRLYADQEGSTKYERAALRWLERYLVEGSPELRELAVMAANLAELES